MTLKQLKKVWGIGYLLNIDANPKTVKGQKLGFMTAVLYLAPYSLSGYNVCPMAVLAGCWKACLNVQGRGGMKVGGKTMKTPVGRVPSNDIQRARIQRTKFWAEDRKEFLIQLVKEIRAFLKRAERKGLTPVIRLNGMSDIQWERLDVGYWLGTGESYTIFEMFPDVQFYDYTKITKRFDRELPSNYDLALSFSNADQKYADRCWEAHLKGASLVIVYRTKEDIANAATWFDECRVNFVNGDAHDLRFIDPPKSIVALLAKGTAKHDTSGFVQDFR